MYANRRLILKGRRNHTGFMQEDDPEAGIKSFELGELRVCLVYGKKPYSSTLRTLACKWQRLNPFTCRGRSRNGKPSAFTSRGGPNVVSGDTQATPPVTARANLRADLWADSGQRCSMSGARSPASRRARRSSEGAILHRSSVFPTVMRYSGASNPPSSTSDSEYVPCTSLPTLSRYGHMLGKNSRLEEPDTGGF